MALKHSKLFALAALAGLAAACADTDEDAGDMTDAQREAMEETLSEAGTNGRTPVEIKTANCLLWPSNFRGDCNFEPRGRGSFIVRLDEGETFYDDVSEIFVSVYKPGYADIRVMNTDGTSDMLGEAERSETYPACWIGHGFSVCAY